MHRLFGVLPASLLVISLSPVAPAHAAGGYADCFSARGNLSFDQRTYTIDIQNSCQFTPGIPLGKNVLYSIDLGWGGSCANTSGNAGVTSFGPSVTLNASCLKPGSYRPQIHFRSFEDSSSNFVYLSNFTIAPQAASPTPSRSPSPTPSPSLIRPPEPVPAPSSESTLDWSVAGPGDSRPTAGGLRKPVIAGWLKIKQQSVRGDVLRVKALSKMRQGRLFSVVVNSRSPTTNQFEKSYQSGRVGRNGQVSFAVPVKSGDFVLIEKPTGPLARWDIP